MDDENVVADNSNTAEDVDLDTTNDEGGDYGNELAERLAKAEELANNYKIRAEKAERLAKAPKDAQTYQKQALPAGDLSQGDMLAVLKANIHEDDMERVQKFAALEGLSIKDALKSDDLKALLSIREEKRQTASASNVGTSKRGTGKIADDILLENFKNGTVPESDDDIARLVKLRSR